MHQKNNIVPDPKVMHLKLNNPYRRKPLGQFPDPNMTAKAWEVEKKITQHSTVLTEVHAELTAIKKIKDSLKTEINSSCCEI